MAVMIRGRPLIKRAAGNKFGLSLIIRRVYRRSKDSSALEMKRDWRGGGEHSRIIRYIGPETRVVWKQRDYRSIDLISRSRSKRNKRFVPVRFVCPATVEKSVVCCVFRMGRTGRRMAEAEESRRCLTGAINAWERERWPVRETFHRPVIA